jgi:1-deoxy-D-xylulose-5-phosphate reductoisomerase
MTYEPVAHDAFPALSLGVTAGKQGRAAPAVFNAANEEAVALFLDRKISFLDIPRAISSALDTLTGIPGDTIEALLTADTRAREYVRTNFTQAALTS